MNLEKALRAQLLLAQRVCLEPLAQPVKLVGGADFSSNPLEARIGAALVVLDAITLETIDEVIAIIEAPCPYIPGYLCFREGPAFFRALSQIKRPPQVWFLDGNGIAHPRRMGLASFVGVIGQIATIGCAKSAFFPFETPEKIRGAYTIYYNPQGEPVGFCLRTRTAVKPIFVSPGNKVSFEDSLRLTLKFSRFRLPEPLRRAHSLAAKIFKS